MNYIAQETMDMFRRGIEKAVTERIQEICEEEIRGVRLRVEERIRQETAGIAAKAMSWHNMQFRDNNIVITINMPKEYQ